MPPHRRVIVRKRRTTRHYCAALRLLPITFIIAAIITPSASSAFFVEQQLLRNPRPVLLTQQKRECSTSLRNGYLFHSPTTILSLSKQDPFGDFDDDDDDDFNNENWKGDNRHISLNKEKRAPPPAPTNSASSHFFSRKSLNDPSFQIIDTNTDTVFDKLCKGAGITRPSKIQSLAWPVLLKGEKDAIIADQTGSGKTLAYLIPLLQRALMTKITTTKSGDGRKKNNGAPRVLVLAPTAELADQTRAVCDKLSKYVKFSTMVVTASGGKYSTSIRDQIRMLQRQPVDVLISTPGRLSTILRTRNSGLDLSYLQSLVLDEVDVLLIDDTFGLQLRTVGAAAPVDRTQFVFVTATLPDTIVETVEKEFPNVVQVRGPGLHRVAPTIKERLVDVSVPPRYNRDAKLCFDVKAKQLLKALRQTRCRRTLIFCNTVETCRQVENVLKRRDRKGQLYQVRAYHNAMSPEARNENLAFFAHGSSSKRSKVVDNNILVCTDRAARGVDFDAAPVDHVILFDFPKDPAEYVRRVGRTARAGRSGTSTVFAYGWQLPIARSVMGSKLDSFSVAVDDDSDDKGDDEYRGGAKGRRQRKAKRKDTTIKGNIEGGRLWK